MDNVIKEIRMIRNAIDKKYGNNFSEYVKKLISDQKKSKKKIKHAITKTARVKVGGK